MVKVIKSLEIDSPSRGRKRNIIYNNLVSHFLRLEIDSPSRGRKHMVIDKRDIHILSLEIDSPSRGRKLDDWYSNIF